jgi:CBS domain containing-hemolysin-like protein
MLELSLAVAAVLIMSGLCSGTEAALFSIPILRTRQLAQEGGGAAEALTQIRENMSRPIATIVILNNVANIVGSITVGLIATRVLGEALLGVVSGVLTFLVIIFAEIIPKTLGERYAEPIALAAARPVLLLTFFFTPLVWLIELLTSPITKGRPLLPATNEAEIKLLADLGHQQGMIEKDESEMIKRVFQMNDLTAEQIMTPRVAMTQAQADATLDAMQETILRSPHSRIVLVGESVDDVVGIALKSELLSALIAGKGALKINQFSRDPYFVPQSVRADNLLASFRKSRRHLAVVIDEYGGVAGVVSLEDVLETLTGAIVDETDRVSDLRAQARRRGKAALADQAGSEEK